MLLVIGPSTTIRAMRRRDLRRQGQTISRNCSPLDLKKSILLLSHGTAKSLVADGASVRLVGNGHDGHGAVARQWRPLVRRSLSVAAGRHCSDGLGRDQWTSLVADPRDLAWFLLFTLVDACLFQGLLALVLRRPARARFGADRFQPLLVALLARVLFAESINPVGWLGLALGLAGIVCLGVPADLLAHWWLLLDPPNFCSCFSLVRGGCCWPHWRWRWEPC